jgi:flagellar brake protein
LPDLLNLTIEKARMENSKPANALEYVGETEKITHPGQIASLLKRVHDERALLTVTLPGSDNQYRSAVVEVDLVKGYLLLDELHPAEGHARLIEAKKLYAHTRLKGVDIGFAGVLAESASERGMALYKVPLPALIHYRQRRGSYRVHVGAGLAIPVSLNDKDLLHLEGQLCDISAGGIGVRLKSEQPLSVDNGIVFSECDIRLPGNERIHSGLELRFVSPMDQRNFVRLGGRFVGLERSDKKLVEQFVVSLERELLKKRQKD